MKDFDAIFKKIIARPGLEPRSKAPRAPMLATTLPGFRTFFSLSPYNITLIQISLFLQEWDKDLP